MIWGMTLHPGEEFSRKVFGEEHLTLASLECRMSKYQAKGRPSACLLLKTNMREHVICTLEKGVTNQQCLDLVFEQGENITFLSEGTGIIYLTGYTTKQQEQQNEMQEEPSVDIFITDREDEGGDGGNNDKMPDKEVLIKQENDSEDGMQDSEHGGEEMDDEPSTTGDPGAADGSDMKEHDLGCTEQGNGDVKSINGDIDNGHIQDSIIVNGDVNVSGDSAGFDGDKDYRDGGDDRDLHSDCIHGNGIQGDGNNCCHVDNPQVHLSVAGVPTDGDSMYDNNGDDIMGKLGKEERDADGKERKVDDSNDRKGASDHQEGREEEIIDTICTEQQEGSIKLVSQRIEGALTGIPDVSLEKENWDISSKLKNSKSFAEPLKKSKGGNANYKNYRCNRCWETFSENRLHRTHGVKCIVGPKRKHHWKNHSKVHLRCEYFGRALDYKCGNERLKASPLGVKHSPSNGFRGQEIKVV